MATPGTLGRLRSRWLRNTSQLIKKIGSDVGPAMFTDALFAYVPQTVVAGVATATATGVDPLVTATVPLGARGLIRPIRSKRSPTLRRRVQRALLLTAAFVQPPAQTATPTSATAVATALDTTAVATLTVTAQAATASATAASPSVTVVLTVAAPSATATATATTASASLGSTAGLGARGIIKPVRVPKKGPAFRRIGGPQLVRAHELVQAQAVTATVATASATGTTPSGVIGGVTVTGAVATASATGTTPTITLGAISRTATVATATATGATPTARSAIVPVTAVASAYGIRVTTASTGLATTDASPVERQRWVEAVSLDDANARLRRTVEVLDSADRVDALVARASGTLGLTYPQTLVEADTTSGAVTLTLPDATKVPGFRVDVVLVAGSNTLTVQTVTVSTYAGFVSTGATWRRVA